MKSQRHIASLLVAASTVSVGTAVAGDALELVLSGNISTIYNYGTLPGPFASWPIGEPYELRVLVDPRHLESHPDGDWRVLSMSIAVQGVVYQASDWSPMWMWSESQPPSSDELAWDAVLEDPNGELHIAGGVHVPVGELNGLETLDCESIRQVFSLATSTWGGIVRPDDEAVFGPCLLTACNVIPCHPGVCAADFNCDGGVDGGDVEAFFREWEMGRWNGDVDRSGGVDGADVEAFFFLWERGEC